MSSQVNASVKHQINTETQRKGYTYHFFNNGGKFNMLLHTTFLEGVVPALTSYDGLGTDLKVFRKRMLHKERDLVLHLGTFEHPLCVRCC